jgi:hypothetical protein
MWVAIDNWYRIVDTARAKAVAEGFIYFDGGYLIGIDQMIRKRGRRDAPFYRGEILGIVLENETDALFLNRERRLSNRQ